MKRTPTRLRLIAAAVGGLLVSAMIVAMPVSPASAAGTNLALGKTMTSSGVSQTYVASNANDGNQASYWESTNNAFPQWLQVDLGSSTSVNQIVLKLPTGWGSRTETLSVQSSTDGSTFSTFIASATYSFDGSANTVTINFTQASTRYLRLNFTANSGWPAGQISEFEVYGPTTTSSNLALGKTATSSGYSQTYAPGNTVDGNQQSYWESTNNAFPQWLQVDLGSSVSTNKIVLKLPTGSWGARTETLSINGSADGTNFSTLVASATYSFDGSGNVVTINFGPATTRYIRLIFTANSAWPAGQVSEFEVYGPTGGDTSAPTAPSNLAYTLPQSGKIALTWGASSDNVGVTGYDIYLNNTLLTSVPSSATSYTDSEPDTLTATYFVRAHDAAGNASANSNSVTRTGQTGDQTAPTAPSNLAVTTPTSGTVKLTWSASTDNVGVTSYVVYRNGSLDTTVSGTTLTYSESQPDTATVMYYVVAKDAAGNQSQASNTVTRAGTGGTSTNLALGKPVVGSAPTFTFVATNANDGLLTTYFEGASYPTTATVQLGANASLTSVVVALNPDPSWGTRTQTIAVLGREQSSSTFTTISAAQVYTFNPASGNSVTIPVSGTYADVELSITTNSGAPGGQVAEFQVFGTPAPNPDLTITTSSWTPTAPVETDAVTLSATVKNNGTAASGATNVNFYLGSTKVGTAAVGTLAAGATQVVTANVGTQTAGTYSYTAKVDEANTVIELNDANNSFTNGTSLVVAPVQSSDLVASVVSWNPSNPSNGQSVAFTVNLKNQGTIASAAGAHGITLTVINASTGTTVATLNGSYSGSLAAGASANVSMGSWTAANGKYSIKTVIAVDANELAVKQANNTATTSMFVGQGANMPYDMYEAEAGTVGGGATVLAPNRTIGDLAGEASGRQAVELSGTGQYVQWTSREATNTFVVRFNIPDSAGGGGITSTLDLYVNGNLIQPLSLTSHFEWLYGAETGPGNSPGTGPRHLYDEASFVLPATYPTGSTIKLQRDASNNATYYSIDFMQLELATPVANPDPAHLVVPTGFDQASVQAALDKARMDTTGTFTGVYLPAGQYSVTQKFTIYGKGIKVIGAGPWFTQFIVPTSQENTDAGWSLQSGASGSTFQGFGWFGNFDARIDGPGHTWDLKDQSNITIDNVWIEHTVVGVWGAAGVTNSTFTNMRIRDTFADGINLTNHSTGNLISNDEARSTGDDSFVLFAANDQESGNLENNTIQNVTALTPWRAAGVAVYGGDSNTIQNFYVADTLCYSGLTVSSLNFGYAFQGFGSTPTNISNFSLVRDGGHFWGDQVFGAIWVFSATQPFQHVHFTDATITNPTYSGIMFQTDYSGGAALNSIQDTTFLNTTITGAQQSGDQYNAKSGYGIWANPLPESGQGPAVGSATFTNLTESNNFVNIQNTTTTFTITVN